MRTMSARFMTAALVVTWTVLGATAQLFAQANKSGNAGPQVVPAAAGGLAAPAAPRPAFTDRPEDERALQSVARAYTTAYDSANTRALGDLFADDAEFIDEHGDRLRGRATIEGFFDSLFKERPGATLTIVPASLRFLGPDVAQEEGQTIVKATGEERPSSRHYTVTFVKQGNRWRYSIVPRGARDQHDPAPTIAGAGMACRLVGQREPRLAGSYDLPLDRRRQFPASRFHGPGAGQVGHDRE